MNALETINDLKDELNKDIQSNAEVARSHYHQMSADADTEVETLRYKAKAERANALWWVCQSESWANMAEGARNSTLRSAADAAFTARGHDLEAEHAAGRADLYFDQSVHFNAEYKAAKAADYTNM